MPDDSLELFHKHIRSSRYKLECLIGESENNCEIQELNLAIEQLNSYQIIINQQFQLLMSIDPMVDNLVVNSVIVKINEVVTRFVLSFCEKSEPNKFVNYQPIDGYVK